MNTHALDAVQLAQMIDHTLLKPNITFESLKALCQTARAFRFKTVMVNGAAIPFCREQLEGSVVLCATVAGFPLGQSTVETKVFEACDAIQKGAAEVDYVVNLAEVKSGHWDRVEEEMRRITAACHDREAGCKVIFENCFLTEEEKRRLCEIALKVKPDFIKTSTGYGTGGATLDDVRLMKACVGDEVAVKAAGGIRTVEEALAMIEAGASRIGTSAGVKIVEDFRGGLGQ